MEKRNKRYWKICIILVIALTILGFSPLVIPGGQYLPMIFGVPYSLVMSFLVTLALVVLTYIGGKVHPGRDEEEGEL
jgi:uncharacterized membrane protein